MRGHLIVVFTGAALAASVVTLEAQTYPPPDPPPTHVVRMVEVSPADFAFEPARITVRPGDVIRFTQAGALPHNVELRGSPDGVELGDARMGPFLTAKGQSYDLVIDERFAPGEYEFVCTPHVAMGMKGTIVVAGPSTR